MKTSPTSAITAPELRYVPYAFKARESYPQRMTAGIGIGAAMYALAFLIYFMLPATQAPAAFKPLSPEWIPAPPPVEDGTALIPNTTTGNQPAEGKGTADEKPNGGLGEGTDNTPAGRARQAAEGAAAFQAGMAAAMQGGIFGEAARMGGVPSPTASAEDAANTLLGSLTPHPMRGVSGSTLGQEPATTEVGFGGTRGISGQGTGIDIAGGVKGLGAAQGAQAMKLSSTATLKIRENVRNLVVSEGERDAAEIAKVMKHSHAALEELFAKLRTRIGEANGRVVVRLLIRPDGGVQTVKVMQSSLKDDDFIRSVEVRLSRLIFSAVSLSEMQQVEIPIEFND